MPESEGLTKGIGGLLGKSTAGLPNWAWLLVIAGGIAAAIFLPKLFGGGSSTDGSTSAPTDTLPTPPPIGGYGGDGGTGGINPQPPIIPQPPPLPDCSLEKSCAQPPTNGKCPPGMHLAKDGLCRCNAKGMVNWGTVCLPPGQIPPGYQTSTVTNPPANTTSAVAGQEASTASANDKLQQQNGLMPPSSITPIGSILPIIHKPPPGTTLPPIKKTPRWPNKEDE